MWSPQILDPGTAATITTTTNGIPSLHHTDLLLSESSPQRFTKMIMQPSQELPAEIFQNEQTVTVTSPQKIAQDSEAGAGSGRGGDGLRGDDVPAAGAQPPPPSPSPPPGDRPSSVRQNSAAGDAGNPDQITCLNVFNGSSRRSAVAGGGGAGG